MPQPAGCHAGPGHIQHDTGESHKKLLQGPYQHTYVLFVQFSVEVADSTNGCSLLRNAPEHKVEPAESQVQHAQLMQQLQHCRERLERHRKLCCILNPVQ